MKPRLILKRHFVFKQNTPSSGLMILSGKGGIKEVKFRLLSLALMPGLDHFYFKKSSYSVRRIPLFENLLPNHQAYSLVTIPKKIQAEFPR